MKTFRIGNVVPIKWPILTNGKETPLNGRNLSLFLSDPMGVTKQVPFHTEDNCVYFVWSPLEQKRTGEYSLTLFQDMGTENQLCVDTRAFCLVAHSEEVPSDMSAEEIGLDSIGAMAVRGQSAYEIAVAYGYEGTEEEWAEQYNTVLTSTEIIVQKVAETSNLLDRAERIGNELVEYEVAESNRNRSEKDRNTAESLRADAEMRRIEAETERGNAEEERKDAEQRRAEEEQERNVRSVATQNGIAAFERRLQGVIDMIEQASQIPISDRRRVMVIAQTEAAVEIQPNVMNVWQSPMTDLSITFAPGVVGYENEYMIRFACPIDDGTVLYMPDVKAWANNSPIEPEPGVSYEISVIDGLAAYAEYRPSE